MATSYKSEGEVWVKIKLNKNRVSLQVVQGRNAQL